MKKTYSIRPYARLLTMLGEQLIKNERIALVELIKNSYDADADWVKISFIGFDTNYQILPDSKLVIEDNGIGMDLLTIEKCWMNPATPNKYSNDKTAKKTLKKERVIQGEKGIGRFATLKLGRDIKIITRPENSNEEYVIEFNLSIYDDEFLTLNGKKEELYIDDIKVNVSTQLPKYIIGEEGLIGKYKLNNRKSGTRIEISNLKGNWSEKKVKEVYYDVSKLESIFSKIFQKKEIQEFTIDIDYNNSRINYDNNYLDKLSKLFENSAVLKITEGSFNNQDNKFIYKLNNQNKLLNLSDSSIRGLNIFRSRFFNMEQNKWKNPDCGNFEFNFFVFDFDMSEQTPVKYKLDKEDKNLLKQHRIYLYRDNIRVYPYGDQDDDWLRTDTLRGTISAGQFFSNDQVVGWIGISKENNSGLKDKTNREGLIEEGDITGDFIALIQTFLSYIRQHDFAQYQASIKDRKVHDIIKQKKVNLEFDNLKEQFKNDNKAISLIDNAVKAYTIEKKYLEQRVKTTEELASVGLSVETASHDIMLILSKGVVGLDNLISDCLVETIESNILNEELQKLRGMFSFVEARMKDVQLLFKSSKQRLRNIRVKEVLEKVIRIYNRTIKDNKIELLIEDIGSPLVAKCTDAVLLQLFINLFDNAIYWLNTVDIKDKKINILLDGQECKVVFSDNGPGINSDDAPYIFEAFYSGKGEDGRGLGLYIARQLLERLDYSIELADIKSDKKLKGANFIIVFIKSEE